ncbi:MAG: GDP-mannose 4,6-dehydratase [Halioglobus sp.]
MTGKTILITGASGFTGQHFIALAKDAGYHCVALCHHPDEAVPAADECIVGNLLDPSSLQVAITHAQPDYVLHLAAISFVAHGNASEIYQVNQLGTVNLLDAIREGAGSVEKILLASSANIYGNTKDLPITESTLPNPANHYGMSKYTMELATQLYADLPVAITRPFNYTGCGQTPNFLIPKIVSAFRAKQTTIELGNLDVARDFSDVRDVVTAYLRLLTTDTTAPAYNICSGTPSTLLSVIDTLNAIAGYEIKVTVNPDFVRSDEIKTLYGSPALLESAIGDYRSYTLDDTLRWMMA